MLVERLGPAIKTSVSRTIMLVTVTTLTFHDFRAVKFTDGSYACWTACTTSRVVRPITTLSSQILARWSLTFIVDLSMKLCNHLLRGHTIVHHHDPRKAPYSPR
jgi:hypothetical protein